MKKYLIILLLLPVLTFVSQAQTCTVSGTISGFNTVGVRSVVTIKEVRRSGYIMPIGNGYNVPVSNAGAFKFVVPISSGTDTTKVRIHIPGDASYEGVGNQGVWVIIPHASTAVLSNLVTTVFVAPGHAIVTPLLQFRDSTGVRTVAPDTIHIGSGLLMVNRGGGSNDYTLIVTSTTDTAGYFLRYGGVMTETDPVWIAQKGDYYTKSQVNPVQDSTKKAYDTLAQHRVQIDTKQNVLTAAQIARIDSILGAGYRINITSAGQIQVLSVDTTGLTQGARITALESDVASAGKWNQYDAVGTYKIIVPKISDSAKVKIDNLGKTTLGEDLDADSLIVSKITLKANAGTGDNYAMIGFTDAPLFVVGKQSIGYNYLTKASGATGSIDGSSTSPSGIVFVTGALNFIAGSPSSSAATLNASVFSVSRKLGAGVVSPVNSLETSGNIQMPKDSTADLGIVRASSIIDSAGALNPSGSGIAAQVTSGAGDSVTVTVTGVLPTDVITVSYIGGTTAPTIHPWSNVFAANTLTLYGDNGRKLAYIRIRK
jgi:hypothetical protein